jgi:PAS domain S-box-containing protein
MSNTAMEILLVEDNIAEAVLLKKALSISPFGQFAIATVKRLSEALEQLQAKPFDAVLLDLGLPDSQGIETLERICRQKPRAVAVVVLTGLEDEAMAIKALKTGAEDYLVKGGVGADMAGRALRYAIERKRASEAVIASEKRLALAVDATQMGIFDWNIATGKVTLSDHHARLFGMKHGSFAGTFDALKQCIHVDDRVAVKAAFERSLKTLQDFQQEFRVVWPDGTEYWVEGRGRVFEDSQGRPQQMLGTVVDISQRKAAQYSAWIREGELTHLSRVATMGQMASGLAHELNQPLTAILNYATVCLSEAESGNGSSALAVQAITEVMDETRRAGTIISRMRSFVRKQKPQNEPVDINELVRESNRLMEFELRHQRMKPELDLQDGIPPVMGDVVQIEQVVVNLLFNALEAMEDLPRDQKRLIVESALIDRDRSVQVSVIDSGAGISDEHMSRLFQPFFTTKSKGLGMGLNICRSMIESHGGRLTATRNSDSGMRFCFTLPVAEGAQL